MSITDTHLRGVLDICLRLSSERNPEILINRILESACWFTGAGAGGLLLVEQDPVTRGTGVLVPMAIHAGTKVAASVWQIRVQIDNQSVTGACAYQGKVINIPDVALDPMFSMSLAAKAQYEVQNMLVVPMKDVDGRVVGVLELLDRRLPSIRVWRCARRRLRLRLRRAACEPHQPDEYADCPSHV